MEDNGFDSTVEKVNNALNSEDITNVINSWNDQRDLLREQLRLFWLSSELQFKMWWSIAGDDVRKAMVMTALEDLPTEVISLDVLCPELTGDLDSLLSSAGSRIILLMQGVLEGRENSDDVFEQKSTMLATFEELELTQPLFAAHSLLSLRSCLLLHFLNDIVIIYEAQKTVV